MQGSTSGIKRFGAVIFACAMIAACSKGGIISQTDIPKRQTGLCLQLACGTVIPTKKGSELGKKYTIVRKGYNSRVSKQQVFIEPNDPQKSKGRYVNTRKGH